MAVKPAVVHVAQECRDDTFSAANASRESGHKKEDSLALRDHDEVVVKGIIFAPSSRNFRVPGVRVIYELAGV
jgi:hypothetical protein